MEDPNLIKAEQGDNAAELKIATTKKVYAAPQLNPYGNLVDLVRNQAFSGNDGGCGVFYKGDHE